VDRSARVLTVATLTKGSRLPEGHRNVRSLALTLNWSTGEHSHRRLPRLG